MHHHVLVSYLHINTWNRTEHYDHWCPGAKAPGHQYPQFWLKLHYIGPVLHKNSMGISMCPWPILRHWPGLPSLRRCLPCNVHAMAGRTWTRISCSVWPAALSSVVNCRCLGITCKSVSGILVYSFSLYQTELFVELVFHRNSSKYVFENYTFRIKATSSRGLHRFKSTVCCHFWSVAGLGHCSFH